MNLPIIEDCLKIITKKVYHTLLTTTTHVLLCTNLDEYVDYRKVIVVYI